MTAKKKQPKKLALIFMEPSASQAPMDAERWALAWDMSMPANVTRWYEIHHRRVWHSGMSQRLCVPKRYAGWMASLPGTKVLWQKEKDVPESVAYPMARVAKMRGVGTYLASSMAYMLCQGVLEGFKDIGLYGCDFYPYAAWQERLFEMPNLAYLTGLFRAQGITVRYPEASRLWELEVLENRYYKQMDFAKAVHVLYAYGHYIGMGNVPDLEFEKRWFLLPWQRVPFYGHETLEEVGAVPALWKQELRREMGV